MRSCAELAEPPDESAGIRITVFSYTEPLSDSTSIRVRLAPAEPTQIDVEYIHRVTATQAGHSV